MKNRMALFLAAFFCLSAYPLERAGATYLVPAKVGLVLIGATADGFTLAVDGSSLNADGRVSQEQKLFQAGQHGAVAIFGTVSLQDPLGAKVRGELNIARVASAWLSAHPDVDVAAADRDLNAAVTAEMNKFFSTRGPGATPGAFEFGLVIAGFADGKRVVSTTRYFAPISKGRPVRTQHTSMAAHDFDVWVYGNASHPRQSLSTGIAAIQKLKRDYSDVFREEMAAAESDDSKKHDGKSAIVAAPNRFAAITANEGFAWKQ